VLVIDFVVDGVVFVEVNFERLSTTGVVVVVTAAMVVAIDDVVVVRDRGPGIGSCVVGGVEDAWDGFDVVFVVKGGNSFSSAWFNKFVLF